MAPANRVRWRSIRSRIVAATQTARPAVCGGIHQARRSSAVAASLNRFEPQVSSGESMKRKHFNRRAVPLTNCSRRGFLAASTAALGAATLSRPLVLLGAAAASTAANNKLNLALVGCGGQGRGDMRGMLSCGANLVALCDPDPAQIESARGESENAHAMDQPFEMFFR